MLPIFLQIKHLGSMSLWIFTLPIHCFAALQASRHLWVPVFCQGCRQQSSSLQGYSLSGISVRIFQHETGNKWQKNRVKFKILFQYYMQSPQASLVVGYLSINLNCRPQNQEHSGEPAPSHRSALWGLLFPPPQNKKHWLVIWGDPKPVEVASTVRLPELEASPYPPLSYLWSGLNNGSCFMGLLGGLHEASMSRI